MCEEYMHICAVGNQTRIGRLADIAELYYLQERTQSEIAELTGINRTTISRMLTEARREGIVEIRVERPLEFDLAAQAAMRDAFPELRDIRVVLGNDNPDIASRILGQTASALLENLLVDDCILGVTWGRTLAATAGALAQQPASGVEVVQLAGAIAAHSGAPQQIVQTFAQKLSGTATFVNAPFLVENDVVATALLRDPSNRDALDLASRADVALFGMGSTNESSSSLLSGGHLDRRDLRLLSHKGAVGDVAGHPIDADGFPIDSFARRIVGLGDDQLRRIPIRLGVAGGEEKARVVQAALHGGYLTHLATDTAVAEQVLDGA